MKVLLKFILLNILIYICIVKCTSSTTRPKISIIIPVYNSEKYIDRSLQSALNQTLEDIEVICIDDASQDSSLKILRNYEQLDPRVRVYHFKKNKGASQARNKGIKLAKGKFIGFIDSDDYVDKEFYENLYKHSEHHDVIVGKFVDSTNYSDNYLPNDFPLIHGYVVDSIWKRSFLRKHNVEFPVNVRIREDKEFRKRCYQYNPRIFNTTEDGIFYYYKRREGSVRNFNINYLKSLNEKAKQFKMDVNEKIHKIGLIVKRFVNM
ncbi:hypothetical protein H8356DRAFT_1654705 [Neocallimastix lanati (nom. inval.)]|uniref:Glycosyltransferase 2-like domain-containing protein n=1 Tax=Neocallimastix californiae TaxID=1754190 RepID=A0A1Y2C583_9FUNG|nr:hypothetical protein H8356DRAFT_1654705 [Neocallimastix sp. JGI-2020a]ORY41475.1 hypothetical protein LY90DRAFT_672024 [Neocallimastix californiae]|eukprot:ORY41475.1 hypothetical protein LY90DRAFT_672024 [Neocallimastix californiae]